MVRIRLLAVSCWLVAFAACFLTMFSQDAKSVECTVTMPSGPGCTGCRPTGYTYTKTMQILISTTIPPRYETISVNYKICKICPDTNMNESDYTYIGSKFPGNTNPESVANGTPNCGADATLILQSELSRQSRVSMYLYC